LSRAPHQSRPQMRASQLVAAIEAVQLEIRRRLFT
jgi:hypothetical protein